MSSETFNEDGQPLKYGLSPEDIELLEIERRDLVEQLVRTPDGRSLIKESCPDIDGLGRVLTEEIADLGRVARSDDVLRARAASVLLNEIVQRGYKEATNDLYSHRSPLYSWAQSAHLWLDRKIRARTSGKESRRRRTIAERWGWYGNALTFLAAIVLAVYTSFAVAAVLISARIVITAIIWSMASFPADDSPDKPVLDSDPRICVLGHGGDLMLFAAFGYAMVQTNHQVAGFLVVMAGWIMILGTIFRIGASASGYRVPRLHVERMVRGFSTCSAVALAAISSIPWWWSAVVMITLPTFFAWVEGREAWRAMKLKVAAPFDPIVPSVEMMAMEDGAKAHGVV